MSNLIVPLQTRASHAYEVDASAWAHRGPLPEGLHDALAVLVSSTARREEIEAAWSGWDWVQWDPNDLIIRGRQFQRTYTFAEWAAGRETSIEGDALRYFIDRGVNLSGALNRAVSQVANSHTQVLRRRIVALLDAASDDQLCQAYPLYRAGGAERAKGQGTVLHQFLLHDDRNLMSVMRDRLEPLIAQGRELTSSPDRTVPKLLKAYHQGKHHDWYRHAWMLRTEEVEALTLQRQPALVYLMGVLDNAEEMSVRQEPYVRSLEALAARLGDRLPAHLQAHPAILNNAHAHVHLPVVAHWLGLDLAARRATELAQRPVLVSAPASRPRRRA